MNAQASLSPDMFQAARDMTSILADPKASADEKAAAVHTLQDVLDTPAYRVLNSPNNIETSRVAFDVVVRVTLQADEGHKIKYDSAAKSVLQAVDNAFDQAARNGTDHDLSDIASLHFDHVRLAAALPSDLRSVANVEVNTYNGGYFTNQVSAGTVEEYGAPQMPVKVENRDGIVLSLGLPDHLNRQDAIPGILCERQPDRWVICLASEIDVDHDLMIHLMDDKSIAVVEARITHDPLIEYAEQSPDPLPGVEPVLKV